MPELTAELWQAYRAARYDIALSHGKFVTLRVGQVATGLDDCWAADSHAFYLTAHNPGSQLLSVEENARREDALKQQVLALGWRFLPAVSRDVRPSVAKKWPDERGLLLFGATILAVLRLAAEFQQHAILSVPRSGSVECVAVEDQCEP